MKKVLIALLIIVCAALPSISLSQVFFEDFKGSSIDTTVWKIGNQVWGNVPDKITNGGVVPQNAHVANGNLIIEAHGNLYKGPIKGFGQNTRVGAAVYTAKPFASGKFEVHAKICPHPGALSAFWTYYYENDDYNHEIDFEMPGNNQAPHGAADSDLSYGLATCWRGVGKEQYHTEDKFFGNQTDGKYHTYRFEWHTGGGGKEASVEWFYDDKLIATNKNIAHVPTHAASFWLGVWFPTWIKEANFDTELMYIDWVRITPFHEPGDIFLIPKK